MLVPVTDPDLELGEGWGHFCLALMLLVFLPYVISSFLPQKGGTLDPSSRSANGSIPSKNPYRILKDHLKIHCKINLSRNIQRSGPGCSKAG